MTHEEIQQLAKQRQLRVRSQAALGTVQGLLVELSLNTAGRKEDGSRVDNPWHVLRSIFLDLFDGCYDEGFSAGQDRPASTRGEQDPPTTPVTP